MSQKLARLTNNFPPVPALAEPAVDALRLEMKPTAKRVRARCNRQRTKVRSGAVKLPRARSQTVRTRRVGTNLVAEAAMQHRSERSAQRSITCGYTKPGQVSGQGILSLPDQTEKFRLQLITNCVSRPATILSSAWRNVKTPMRTSGGEMERSPSLLKPTEFGHSISIAGSNPAALTIL